MISASDRMCIEVGAWACASGERAPSRRAGLSGRARAWRSGAPAASTRGVQTFDGGPVGHGGGAARPRPGETDRIAAKAAPTGRAGAGTPISRTGGATCAAAANTQGASGLASFWCLPDVDLSAATIAPVRRSTANCAGPCPEHSAIAKPFPACGCAIMNPTGTMARTSIATSASADIVVANDARSLRNPRIFRWLARRGYACLWTSCRRSS